MANKDFDIVQALLQREENVTRDFFIENVTLCLSPFTITIIQIVLLA